MISMYNIDMYSFLYISYMHIIWTLYILYTYRYICIDIDIDIDIFHIKTLSSWMGTESIL